MDAAHAAKPSISSRELLESIILTTVDVPSLPPMARKVLQIISNDRSSMTELQELIYKDHSFATRVLRIANSSFYGRRQSVDTIADAVLLIGFKTLKSLVLGASMRDLHRRFGPVEKSLWQHSLCVSITASLIARETAAAPPEEALVAGLVHDVGKTILNNSVADYYVRIVERAAQSGIPSVDAEREAFGFSHCDVGGYIARKWLFPADLVCAIEHHHAETLPPGDKTELHTICRIVSTADSLCLRLGIGMRRDAAFSAAGLDELGLTEERLLSLGEAVRSAYAEQAMHSPE